MQIRNLNLPALRAARASAAWKRWGKTGNRCHGRWRSGCMGGQASTCMGGQASTKVTRMLRSGCNFMSSFARGWCRCPPFHVPPCHGPWPPQGSMSRLLSTSPLPCPSPHVHRPRRRCCHRQCHHRHCRCRCWLRHRHCRCRCWLRPSTCHMSDPRAQLASVGPCRST